VNYMALIPNVMPINIYLNIVILISNYFLTKTISIQHNIDLHTSDFSNLDSSKINDFIAE
jgi:hypothetical protein